MSNLEDFFGTTGGRLFQPSPSKTFSDPGTLAFNAGTGGKLEGSGQRAPVVDNPYHHLNLPVLLGAGGTGFTMVRGRNMGGSVWSNDFGSPPTPDGDYFGQAYWYDTTNNFLYWLSKSTGGTSSNISAIQKVNVVDGTWTELFNFTISNTVNANTFGHTIYPIDPNNPDTSNWIIITPEQNSPYRMRAQEYDSSGTSVGGAKFFKVDTGGPNEDEVNFQGGYITAANDLMISPIYGVGAPTNLASGYMTFSLLRGATRIQVVLPLDGIAPLPESNVNLTTAGITPFFNVMLTPWGDSVLALTDNQSGAAAALLAYFGTRIWDRTSFDAELHRLADTYSAAPAEVYFT